MDEQKQQEASEGIVGQSASTAGLARWIVFHWNQAVKETGDGTYPIIIAKFAERIAFDEREACAAKAHRRGVIAAQLGQTQAEACAKDIYEEIVGRSNVESEGAEPLLAKLPLD
jgi:hypothetical protein